jgi:hypothetical protein
MSSETPEGILNCSVMSPPLINFRSTPPPFPPVLARTKSQVPTRGIPFRSHYKLNRRSQNHWNLLNGKRPQIIKKKAPLYICGSRDSSVGVASGYGLKGQGPVVRVKAVHVQFWGPRSPLSIRYREISPGGKEAGTWSWSFTSKYCRDKKYMDIYIHSPIRLHGIALN